MIGFYIIYWLFIAIVIAIFVTQVAWPIMAGVPLFWALSKTGRVIRKELKLREEAELNNKLKSIRRNK